MASAPVVVAGAGIGGLAAALALAQVRQPVLVLEQASQFSEIGAGIQLGPNAWRALRRLGVADSLAEQASFPESIQLRDAPQDKLLQTVPLGYCKERFGEAIGNVHRAHLHQVLLAACRHQPGITIAADAKVLGWQTDSGSGLLSVSTATGTHAASAVIGADGIHSQVRKQLWPASGELRLAMTTVRALLAADDARLPAALKTNCTQVWWAPDAHAVLYPVDCGRQVNLVAFARAADLPSALSQLTQAMQATALAPLFSDSALWSSWPLYRQKPLAQWTRGCASLLGDAAHASLPFLAQGAAMALEDAVALGDCVAREPTLEGALHHYDRLRQPRARRVQQASSLMAHVDHASGPVRWARNRVLGWRHPSSTLETLAWIYEY